MICGIELDCWVPRRRVALPIFLFYDYVREGFQRQLSLARFIRKRRAILLMQLVSSGGRA